MLSLEQGALDLKLTRIWMPLSSCKLVNTEEMHRGYIREDGKPETFIYER